MLELQQWSLQEVHHGRRLDHVLSQLVAQASRSHLQSLIEAGAVTLNGTGVCKPSTKVVAGQTLAIEFRPSPKQMAFLPESMALDIVHQDAHILVLNKPAGLVVHPAAGNWSGTLLNGLLALSDVHGSLPRAGIVHRLDKDTSGLMVVARSRLAMDRLVAMIAQREVSRVYLAIAHGAWSRPQQLTSTEAIGRDPRNRLRMAVVDLERQSGKPACTHLRLLARAAAHSLVQAKLDTGRTHQIRVHMSHLGHPLVGDVLYGGRPDLGMTRQALHATRLSLPHPVTGEPLDFQLTLPQDMMAAAAGLGWDTMTAMP